LQFFSDYSFCRSNDDLLVRKHKSSDPCTYLIGRRFEMACEKLGFNVRKTVLTTEHFRPPKLGSEQLSLFG
jgi:hypothetical protein